MSIVNGLTCVKHEDLIMAVENWSSAKKYYHTEQNNAVKFAQDEFSKLGLLKRFLLKLKTADWIFFYPVMTIYSYGVEFILSYERSIDDGKFIRIAKCSEYFYDYIREGMVANECRMHSKYDGVHYLTPEQVKFVSKFKYFEES